MRTYRLVVSAVVAAFLVGAAPAQAAAATTSGCGVDVEVSTFHDADGAFRENLEFDGDGGLWVANAGANGVEHYDSDGNLLETVTGIRAPAAIRKWDNALYVNYGNAVQDYLLPFNNAGVVKLDLATRQVTPYARGLHVANGSAFDSAGNLYVANAGGLNIARVRPGGQVDTNWALLPSDPNGVTVIGDTLYASLTLDPLSSVVAVPLANPGAWRVVTRLASPLYKGLDDLYAGPDGRLYVVSNLLGELFRVDPATGASCLLADGLPAGLGNQFTNGITSVRTAHDFGPHDGDLFLTAGDGRILRLTVR